MAYTNVFPPNPLSSDSLNIRAGAVKTTPLTAAEVAHYLKEFHRAEESYTHIMNNLYDRTLKPSILNIGVRFQNQRDEILADYLDWDTKKKQFDDGLITFEEFVTIIAEKMHEMQIYQDLPE